MTNRIISEINIYPIKSLGGISLQTSELTERGLKYDRRWMLIDESGKFLTQRVIAQMALFRVAKEDDRLIVTHKTKEVEPLNIPAGDYEEDRVVVQIWNDTCKALRVSTKADEWFSNLLGVSCRLVYMPEDTHRRVDRKYASNDEIVSFADAYPFLIIGQSSLDDLNERLEVKIPMNRFRPNFVFTGGSPYEEDNWKYFRAGPVLFHAVKPCLRCVIPTTDQNTAERSPEPIKTLSTYRSRDNNVMFGQNLLNESGTRVCVGDAIEVVSWKNQEQRKPENGERKKSPKHSI